MTFRCRFSAPLAALAAALLLLTGCGVMVPADPRGALDRIENGLLRAGASPSADLVVVDGDRVSGPLADLVTGFADAHDARVVWTVGSEEDLVDGLERGALDLAIGGMTEQTPWSERVSVTRGYPGIPGSHGEPVVVLLPLGENRLQSALERYLDAEQQRHQEGGCGISDSMSFIHAVRIACEPPMTRAMSTTVTLMVGVMAVTVIGPFFYGRVKAQLAPVLHNKVLYADADMAQADWTTTAASIGGVLGIGVGWARSSTSRHSSCRIGRGSGWTISRRRGR